jgi:type II secretory pathway component PulC
MSFKYIVLNLLVLFLVLMVSIKNYETWTQPIGFLPEGQETVKKPTVKPENPPVVDPNKEPASLRSFIVISEKNIFSPERKDFPTLATVEKSNPSTRPQVILYGVTIAGDFQTASVTSPGRPLRKGERETVTLKLGEQIGGYKLAKIQPDRITMESNGDSFDVLLYDSRNPKKRTEVKTEVKPAAVISTQPAAAPQAPPVPQATPPATARPPASVEKVPPPASIPRVPPAASVEKPREPTQQQAPSLQTPTLRPYPSSLSQRRGRRPVYSPPSATTGVPGQAEEPEE